MQQIIVWQFGLKEKNVLVYATHTMEDLLNTLVKGLRSKRIDALSAVAILKEAARLARNEPNPHRAVEEALRRLAAGNDGISGTEDDLLPPSTVDQLVKLVDTGLVAQFVDAFMPTVVKACDWCCFC